MPIYEYQGRNKDGELILGKRLAQSPDTLSTQLISEGIIPVRIQQEKEVKNLWHRFLGWMEGRKISTEELGIFSRQMYVLCKTGVPITASLKQLAENARSALIANALYGIVEDLESGQDLATAMQHYPEVFTPIMVSMIRVGQNSGRLDEAFLRLNQYLELEASAFKRIKSALRYPIIVVTGVIVGVFIINIFVIPTFAKVFSQADVPLPWITVFLINLSNFFLQYWIFISIFFIALLGGVYYYLHTPKGEMAWDRYKFRIPVIGKLLQRIMLLRFAQSFAVVIHSGISLLEGLDLVAKSIQNKYSQEKILAMREEVEHGKTLTQAASNTGMFTPLELQMLSVSEETGELDTMFEQIASYYRREVEYDLKRLSDLIEPMLLIILSVIILFFAFAVYLPIWNMVKFVNAN